MSPKLSVIIVSWNTCDLLTQAIESLHATYVGDDGLEIIVVDNASADDTAAVVRERYPRVRLIELGENLGFAGGNNRGIAEARSEFLLLLNSDTRVLPGALSQLMSYLRSHPKVGMVGPRLLNADGTTQSSRRRFPSLLTLFLESTWLQKAAPRGELARFYMADAPDSEAHQVDWITGAAMMVRREVVRDVGGLDEGYFMYSEELDWCRRIREAGWEIAYTPAAEIVHYGGKSSDQVVPARHIYFQTSKLRYARKYHGPIVAQILRVWLLGQYVWQTALESTKWLLGHRRELRAARVQAYWHVLRSGLRRA